MDNETFHQPPDPDDTQDTDTPIADQPPQDQSVSQYVSTIKPLQQQKRRKKILLIVIILILVPAAVIGGYFIVTSQAPDSSSPQVAQNQPSPEPETPAITTDTVEYQSQQFFLSFKHPSDWEIVDERGTGLLTATSPTLDIPLEGTDQSGKVIFTIRKSSTKLDEFEAGNAVAVIDSEKISYQNPSQAQRGETHLSFLSYADSASSGLIDGIYITGDFGYQKGQAIPKVDIQKIDSVYSVTFVACDGACEIPVAIPPSTWQDPDFGGQIKTMIQSLRVN